MLTQCTPNDHPVHTSRFVKHTFQIKWIIKKIYSHEIILKIVVHEYQIHELIYKNEKVEQLGCILLLHYSTDFQLPGQPLFDRCIFHQAWWRHQMETFSTLLALYAGNSLVTGEFPAQRPVTRSFEVFFDLSLNKQLCKHSRGWWFETPSHSLWRHSNVSACLWSDLNLWVL